MVRSFKEKLLTATQTIEDLKQLNQKANTETEIWQTEAQTYQAEAQTCRDESEEGNG